MRTTVLILFGLLCLAAGADRSRAADTPPAIPDTPAGKQFAAWLQAFNSGKRETLRAFIEAHFAKEFLTRIPLNDHVDMQRSMYVEGRGLLLRRIEKSEANQIEAVVQTRLTEEWLRVHLAVAPDAPYPVTGFGARGLPSEAPSQGKLSDTEIVQRLEAYLSRLVSADAFSGAVLVAKDGKILYQKAFGLASKAWNAPNRVDTKFNLGSMNKMFTSVAIAQLAQAGKLAYDDPIAKYLPDYPNKEVAGKVTIHHLLTHTSGIGDYFNEKFMDASRERFRKISDYFPLFVDKPLEFTPGARFRYSNAGFMVLGAIVQKVSGQDYFEYVREHIYKPAGMTNTDAYELDHDTPNLATGYTTEGVESDRDKIERRNNLFMHVIKGGPAGGGYSTVQDLLKFDRALRGHKLLDAQHTDLILSGKVKAFGPDKYAYGFTDARVNGHRIVGHSGGFPGINSNLDMYLDLGYTVAIMTNYDRAAMPVNTKLRAMLTQ